jgi:hypothetical protein
MYHAPLPDERRGRYANDFKFFERAGLPDHAPLPARTKHEFTDGECNKISAILALCSELPVDFCATSNRLSETLSVGMGAALVELGIACS